MTCEEFEELSGAFALDAVTPAEHLAAEEHLATCARCTRLFKEIRGVVSLLPLSVPQIPPPPALKERILATIREESNTATGQPTQRIASVQPQQLQRARRPRWNPGILVAAAVLIFCLLGGSLAWSISLNHQVAVLQQQVTQLTTHPPTSSNVVSYSVKGTNVVQGATGLLYYYPQQHVTVLVMYGLPRTQGVHVYQGWLLHTNGKNITSVTSIGLLNTVNGTASVSFAGNVTGYDAAAVSIEPGPFATPNAPKGSVVALGSLKHGV
jgi:Anti-sigma-K factor rskA/Putative zinc-finger